MATAQSSNNGSTHVTVGVHLGLCARALELGKERAPARVRLSKPFLKHSTGVDVAMLAVYFLFLAISRCLLPSKQEKTEIGRECVPRGEGWEPKNVTYKDATVELENASVYFGFG